MLYIFLIYVTSYMPRSPKVLWTTICLGWPAFPFIIIIIIIRFWLFSTLSRKVCQPRQLLRNSLKLNIAASLHARPHGMSWGERKMKDSVQGVKPQLTWKNWRGLPVDSPPWESLRLHQWIHHHLQHQHSIAWASDCICPSLGCETYRLIDQNMMRTKE